MQDQRATSTSDNLEELRVALNGGDKYKLVSRKLDVESKRNFVKEYISDQRKKEEVEIFL
nr:BPK_HP1_G0058410.mRNA.1.CDS.1 [Saccharomyces cerevisiae]